MSSFDFTPPSGGMGRRVLVGAAYTGVSQAVKIAVQFTSAVVVARLLAPSDFGVVAMATPVLGFVAMFSDIGLGQAAIQKADLTTQQASAVFWITVALATSLGVVLLGLSPLVSIFYGDRRAGWVCAAFVPGLLVGSLGSQHFALLARSMRFRALAASDILGALSNLGATIVAGLCGARYWSLVIGAFAGTVGPVILAWSVLPWRPSPPRREAELGALLRFGAGVTSFNFANFFSRNLDNVLIGRRWGAGQLGLYDRAYKLLLFPLSQVTSPIARVMTPTLARLRADDDAYRRAFLDVLGQTLLLTTPGLTVLIALSGQIIPFVLGERWAGVAPIFAALGFAGLVQPLNNPTGWLFITQGRTRAYAGWGVVAALVNVAAFVIGLPFGPLGVAIAYTVSEYLRTPPLWWLATRSGPVTWRHVGASVLPHGLTAVVGLLGVHWLAGRVPGGVVPTAIVGLLFAYGCALGFALIFPRSRSSLAKSVRLVRELAAPALARFAPQRRSV